MSQQEFDEVYFEGLQEREIALYKKVPEEFHPIVIEIVNLNIEMESWCE